jgi:hypothetical protein
MLEEYKGRCEMESLETLVRAWCSQRENLGEPYGAWGMCAITSQDLAEHLIEQGVSAGQVRITGLDYQGREHWAVWTGEEGEETVIDVTARQFDAQAPYPLIKPIVDWLDDGCEWLVDGLAVDAFPFHTVLDIEPLWSDCHIRDDIEPGEMKPYPTPPAAR